MKKPKKIKLQLYKRKLEIMNSEWFLIGNNGKPMNKAQIEAFTTFGGSIKEPTKSKKSADIAPIFPEIQTFLENFIKKGFEGLPTHEKVYMRMNYELYPDGGKSKWGVPEMIREAVQNALDAIGDEFIGQFGEGGLISIGKSLIQELPQFIFTGEQFITVMKVPKNAQNHFWVIIGESGFKVAGTVVMTYLGDFEVEDANSLIMDKEQLGTCLTAEKDSWRIYDAVEEGGTSVFGLKVAPMDSMLHIDFNPSMIDLDRDRKNADKIKDLLSKVLSKQSNSVVLKKIIEEARSGKEWASVTTSWVMYGYAWRSAFLELFPAPAGHESVIGTDISSAQQATHNGHNVIMNFPDNWVKMLSSAGILTDFEAVRMDKQHKTRRLSWLKSKECKEDTPNANSNFNDSMKLITFSNSFMIKYYPDGDIFKREDRKILKEILKSKMLVLLAEFDEEGNEKPSEQYRSFHRDDTAYIKPEDLELSEYEALRVIVHEIGHNASGMGDDTTFQAYIEQIMAEIGINAYRSRMPKRKRD